MNDLCDETEVENLKSLQMIEFLLCAESVTMNQDGVKKMLDRIDVLDVVDLRNLVKHLRKQGEFFKKICDVMRDSIVIINENGEIFFCNAAARELLGIVHVKPQHVLWKYIPEFVTLAGFSKNASSGSDSFLSKEIKISYPRKSLLSVTITQCDFMLDNQHMFLLRMSDITEERSLNEQNMNQERTASVMLLAGSVAHEIGNPLNALSLRLQLMQRQFSYVKDKSARMLLEQSIKICRDEISRLDSIVKNFLHAIRPKKARRCDVHIDHLLRESIELMEAEFDALNIKVSCDIPVLPVIIGDSDQLKQVFFNLFKNACEAMSHDGKIFLECHATDTDVVIALTDNGTGIDCDIADKLFQPYFSTKQEGNGLGMIIIERILREHGATIDIASARDVGTKITINFPRKDKVVPMLD